MPDTDYAGIRFQFEPSSLEQILGTIGDVLEHLPMAICIYDHLGQIVRYNQAAVDIWGRAPEPNQTHQKFVADCEFYGAGGRLLSYSDMPLVKALKSGRELREQEFTVVRPDGRRVTTIVNINPLRDAEGHIVGAINCIRDVTERKLIDEAFRQSQEHLREQEQRLAATY